MLWKEREPNAYEPYRKCDPSRQRTRSPSQERDLYSLPWCGGTRAPPKDSGYTYPEAHRPPLAGALAAQLAADFGFANEFPNDSCGDLQRVSLYIETAPGLGR